MALAGLALASCHNPVFDYEGDCEVNYYLRFVYDMNLKWADAFPSEVNSVNLYVFNSEGLFVKEFDVVGEPISQPGYLMKLELEPGDYRFVAWCGLVNGEEAEKQFTVPEPVAGVTTIDELTCTLNTLHDAEGSVYSDSRLYFLYHGYLEENLPDSQNGADYYYTMYLTKDTNHVRAMFQQVSGDLDPEALDVHMTAANGEMAFDNALLGDKRVTYLPWNVEKDVLGVGNVDGMQTDYYGVITDLSTCRLMASQANQVYLTVTARETGKVKFSVPVIQYSLTAKKYYEMAYGHVMTDQEFLDRQDEYMLTFFLDENLNYLYTVIDVLEWRVVIHEYRVGD